MGKYLSAIKELKPLKHKVPKLTKPVRESSVSFGTAIHKGLQDKKKGIADIKWNLGFIHLAEQLKKLISRADNSKTMPPEDVDAISMEGDAICQILPDEVVAAVYRGDDIPVPKYKIEGMEKCLHGRWCKHLKNNPPARVLCSIAGVPVFDLDGCPDGWWKRSEIGAVTSYNTQPIKLKDMPYEKK